MLEARKTIILPFLLVFAITQPAWSQETRGTISGRIVDSSDAVIPNVSVAAKNLATGVAITTPTNGEGNYYFEFLNPGSYEITASLAGFKTAQRSEDLRVGDHMRLDITMEPGIVSESVTVAGTAPLLEVSNANRGEVIDNRRMNTIPLAQGNPLLLLALAPGANPGTATDAFMYDEPAYTGAQDWRFDGAPPSSTKFTLNGVANSLTEFGGGLAPNAQPPSEAIQEFNVSRSYDAANGHGAGTSVDVVMKSGTNSPHGALYGFFRRSGWGANSFLDNRAGIPNPDSTYQRVGASLGGPVYIPKLYNGKNRTFFSLTYESTHQKSLELVGTDTVPIAAELKGDLSKLLALGSRYQVYDPLTTTPTGTGFFQRTPFSNNIVPSSRLDPISQNLAKYWPTPNLPGASDGSQNFQPGFASPTNWYQTYTRVDHNFSEKGRLFAHYGILDSDIQWKDDYQTLATGHRQLIKRQTAALDYVRVISPSLLLDLRYGFTRVFDPRFDKSSVRNPDGGFDITTLGLAPDFVRQLDLSQSSLPEVFISGFNGIHDDTRNNQDNSDLHSLQTQADYNRGNHSLTLGFEFRAQRFNSANNQFVMPSYTFGNDYTNGPLNNSPAAPLGQGIAAFLLGQPSTGLIWRRDNYAAYNPYDGLFLQDNWRVTSKLTLNLGVRYEYYGPVRERYNRSARGFDFNASSPIEAQAQAAYAKNPVPGIPVDQFRVRGGYTFAGVGGQPRDLYQSPGPLVSPRLGFAYHLAKESVLRGGYGLYFLPIGLDGLGNLVPQLAGFSSTTTLVPTFDGGVTFAANIQNPFPNGILKPAGAAGGLAINLGQSVTFFNSNLKAPYTQRWSLGLQHMLPSHTLVEVSYVGSRSVKLFASRDLNALPDSYLSTLPFRDQSTISFQTQSFSNPFAGLLPGSALNTALITRNQLLRSFPEFTSVTLGQPNDGYSWYHALEARLEKRFSKGYTYILSYTWSKNMEALERLNPGDPLPYRSLSSSDRPHILSLTGILELPFGKRKRFGAGAPRGLSQMISGWQTSAVWHAMSGLPISLPNLFVDTSFNVKNLALPSDQRTVDKWFNIGDGFVRDPGQQPLYNLRTFPLRFSGLRTDDINFWDISIIKDTHIRESAYVQFQAQLLNAFNHPSFGGVNTSPTSGSFGQVTSELTWPRRIMFGIRFVF